MKMNLPLDPIVLERHKQLYPNSCVTMCVEFVLKLMHALPADSFDLQITNGDFQKSGDDFNEKIIENVLIEMDFKCSRGSFFPLEDLFEKIKSELDNGHYVNCAWRSNESSLFHAYVIYGYEENEFLAITKNYNNIEVEYILDMKTRLKNIQGSDILTFHRINR